MTSQTLFRGFCVHILLCVFSLQHLILFLSFVYLTSWLCHAEVLLYLCIFGAPHISCVRMFFSLFVHETLCYNLAEYVCKPFDFTQHLLLCHKFQFHFLSIFQSYWKLWSYSLIFLFIYTRLYISLPGHRPPSLRFVFLLGLVCWCLLLCF